MDRPHGYDFMLALTAAIERATAAARRDDPLAFDYRERDLQGAVERELFIRLVNDDALDAAFAAPGPAPRMRSALEAAVAAELLGMPEARVERLRPLARAAVRAARRTTSPRPEAHAPGTVCFVMHQPKFVRVVEPLVEAIGTGACTFVSLGPDLSAVLRERGLQRIELDGPPGRPREPRRMGRGLRGEPHLAALLDRVEASLEAQRPACVVVVEGNAPGDEVAAAAARSLGVRSICLQQGWSPIVHNGFRNMTHTAVAVWGDGFAEILAPYNPATRFEPIGNHVLERAPSDSGLADLVGARRAVGVFLQSESPLISAADVQAMQGLPLELARRLPDHAILVREHPGAPLTPAARARLAAEPNTVLVPADRFGLREVLDRCAVAASIYSTTLLEAAALGVAPVVLAVTSMPALVPDLGELGAAAVADGWPAAADAIVRLATEDSARAGLAPGMRTVRERFFANLDGHALDRAVRLIRAS